MPPVGERATTVRVSAPDPKFSLKAAEDGYEIVERGQDYTTFRKKIPLTGDLGHLAFQRQQYTLLENNLNYLDNGVWKPSQDIIETCEDGAVARYGPDKAIFSSDLNSAAVFDIRTSSGHRLQGGVRAIQLTDFARGTRFVLALVKATVPGELLPPNQLLFKDAFRGLTADVVYVWKHNSFSQNIIVREQPRLPDGMDPETTRLEVLTEFLEPPEPTIQEQLVPVGAHLSLVDDVVIGFGSMAALRGTAFSVENDQAVNLGAWNPGRGGVPVLKQWQRFRDGRTFLVESISWQQIAPNLKRLPLRTSDADQPRHQRVSGPERVCRKRAERSLRRSPVQMARSPYRPTGVLIDLDLSVSTKGQVFHTGQTYYIATSFSIGPDSATFQPGCVIKYGLNAWLLIYGPLSFPNTLQSPVFTSKDDDGFGDKLGGSTGSPTYMAAQALWIYYVSSTTAISSARFRWAQRAVEYNTNSGVYVVHTVQNCFFENCQTGVYLDANSRVALTNVNKANVAAPLGGGGYPVGHPSDSPFATDRAFAALRSMDSGAIISPSDTMGAIGPNHFVETVNRQVAIYNKADGSLVGTLLRSQSFFGTTGSADAIDPRVLYDSQWGRWIACAADTGAGTVRLAVSQSNDPTAGWDRYNLPVNEAGFKPDYPTLGVDTNGIYVSVNLFNADQSQWRLKVVAVRKQLGQLSPIVLPTVDSSTNANPYYKDMVLQPAVNFDPVGLDGIAWFIGKGRPVPYPPIVDQQTSPSPIFYGRLQWINNQPQFLENPFSNTISLPQLTLYYDLDGRDSFMAPQQPYAPNNQALFMRGGSRLMMAVIRSGYLWTCHQIGVNSNGSYTNGQAESDLRAAVEWMRFQLSPAVSLTDRGRIYDGADSSPYWYYYPSLAVNSQNDMVIGFSGSKDTEYIGAFYSGRRASGAQPNQPILLQAGRSHFNGTVWGDYSCTSIDPSDDSFWTIQASADSLKTTDPPDDPATASRFATWVSKVVKYP